MRTHIADLPSSIMVYKYKVLQGLVEYGQGGDAERCVSVPVIGEVSMSSSYTCVRILLYMCPLTTTYVSSNYYICVLIILYMYPLTTMYVS
jgi:hypothetical protein